MATTINITAIDAEAKALANERVMVATNQGTYGASEACRKVGTGDPHFANCDIYEVVGDAPLSDAQLEKQFNGVGRLRIFREAISEKRKQLTDLRRQISKARR